MIKALGSSTGKDKGKGSDSQTHVPYRDATLTMLLRDSFGGKSSTSVVINVAQEPEHAEESLCSLKFGERMSIVRNSPTVVTDSHAVDAGQVGALLQRARQELAQMAAGGLGGGFVDGAVNTEKQSLANNMRKLADAEQEVRSRRHLHVSPLLRPCARLLRARCPLKCVVTQPMASNAIWGMQSGGQVRDSMAQMAEARTLGGDVVALESKLRSSIAQRKILLENVEKQQSIKKLWVSCLCPCQHAFSVYA